MVVGLVVVGPVEGADEVGDEEGLSDDGVMVVGLDDIGEIEGADEGGLVVVGPVEVGFVDVGALVGGIVFGEDVKRIRQIVQLCTRLPPKSPVSLVLQRMCRYCPGS
mmetsp:Transcript_23407/g.56748  ORF Transcript_23407/g.56748 Transcript_23407/m.56748 type:complete len:107 (+) Transcript_23407:787-1107(+)